MGSIHSGSDLAEHPFPEPERRTLRIVNEPPTLAEIVRNQAALPPRQKKSPYSSKLDVSTPKTMRRQVPNLSVYPRINQRERVLWCHQLLRGGSSVSCAEHRDPQEGKNNLDHQTDLID
jgi:hypothetical protein